MRSLVVVLWVVTLVLVQGYKYSGELDFLETVTSECEKIPGRGLNKFANISNFPVEKKNDDYFIDGTVSFLWNNDGRFERVEVRGETERYLRGSWGPTTLNIVLPDMCTSMFERATPWYQTIFIYVKEESRNCTYNKGYIMAFEPFTLKPFEVTIPGVDMTGKYRVMVYIIPYDKRNMKMADSIYCFIAPFEIMRI